MRYIKLFAPLIVIIIVNAFWEMYSQPPDTTISTILKFGLLIYYLRLDNTGTPLINTLTAILILMGVSEYLLKIHLALGQVIYGSTACAFGLFYFFRQIQKRNKDRLLKIKVIAVTMFSLFGLLTALKLPTLVPFVVVNLLMASVYFYDRLNKVKQLANS